MNRQRGFAAIGLSNPKTPSNVGSVLRAAHCFGASMVATTGRRYTQSATDVTKGFRHIPLLNVDDLRAVIPHGAVPVAVDLVDRARPGRYRSTGLGQPSAGSPSPGIGSGSGTMSASWRLAASAARPRR